MLTNFSQYTACPNLFNSKIIFFNILTRKSSTKASPKTDQLFKKLAHLNISKSKSKISFPKILTKYSPKANFLKYLPNICQFLT